MENVKASMRGLEQGADITLDRNGPQTQDNLVLLQERLRSLNLARGL